MECFTEDLDSDLIISSTCAGCGNKLSSADTSWNDTINLTRDSLFMQTGCVAVFNEKPIVPDDTAFDWCNAECFGRSIFNALELLGAAQRDPEDDEVPAL